MKTITAISLAFALAACGGGSQQTKATPDPQPKPQANAPETAPRIAHTIVWVDDQDKALAFYTGVLGFAKKDDFTNHGYRWLTVASPDDPDGGELQLALATDPAAKAFQESQYKQHQPAVMFFSSDVRAQVDRIESRGGKFTMPPTEVTAGSVIAVIDDTCGNFLQLTQLAR